MTRWIVPLVKRSNDGDSSRPAMVKKLWKAGFVFPWIFVWPIAMLD